MARRRIHPPKTLLGFEEREPSHIPLDRVRIVDTAVQLLNEKGLKELSMRKIAEALGVKTASLYYHVRDKEQLLQLLGDRISEAMEWPDAALPWRERLLHWGSNFRRALRQYRDAAEIFSSTIALGYSRLMQIEKLFALLAEAGFSEEQLPWVSSLLKNYVLSFAAEEAGLAGRAEREGQSAEELSRQYEEAFLGLPADRFPHMLRLAPHLTRPDWDAEFAFGLGVLLDGLAGRLPTQ